MKIGKSKSLKILTKRAIYFLISFFCFTIASYAIASDPLIHHSLNISLHPEKSNASIHDIVTIPKSIISSIPNFRLNKNSNIKHISLNGKDISTGMASDDFFRLKLPQHKQTDKNNINSDKLVCTYSIPLEIAKNNMETLFISGEDYFYPQPEVNGKTNFKVIFQVRIETPSNMKVVSQGEKLKDIVKNEIRTMIWKESKPQEEILIIADYYHEFSNHHGPIALYAYLRDSDRALASRYFEATKFYIDLYSKLIAPYPYKKFALVEN